VSSDADSVQVEWLTLRVLHREQVDECAIACGVQRVERAHGDNAQAGILEDGHEVGQHQPLAPQVHVQPRDGLAGTRPEPGFVGQRTRRMRLIGSMSVMTSMSATASSGAVAAWYSGLNAAPQRSARRCASSAGRVLSARRSSSSVGPGADHLLTICSICSGIDGAEPVGGTA
jgi:hypothetical protein